MNDIYKSSDMKKALFIFLATILSLATYASTDCAGYRPGYASHYCECQNNHVDIRRTGIQALNHLEFSDSIWFQAMSTTFTDAGMTAYLFSESDVQVDLYATCATTEVIEGKASIIVPSNQTRDLDAQAIKDKMASAGGSFSGRLFMVFYPVTPGAHCELYMYPYNQGPESTAKDPLPVLVDMTYVSSHAYDVYELKAENIPASCALYTQWREASNIPCSLTITRGSAKGAVVAEHDFLDASSYFRFDPNLLAEVRASGESLYMHYRHDASAAGRIVTREATVTTQSIDTTLCQGKSLEVNGVEYSTPGLVPYSRAWVGTSLQVHEYSYNLLFSEPEAQYDTIRVRASELPLLYRGQFMIPAEGTCDYDCLIHHEGECDERYLLHVIREQEIYATACYGETYEWNGTIYTESGSYTQTLLNSQGGDSIVTLHLTMQPQLPVSEEDVVVCGNDGYFWNGQTYYETGDYTIHLQDVNGCDSVAILHLIVSPAEDVVIEQEICMGDSWVWDETGEAYGLTTRTTTIDPHTNPGTATSSQLPFVVSQDAITMDVSKGTIAESGAYYQFNSKNTITLSATKANIVKVELHSTASGTSLYGPGKITVENGTYSYDAKVGTWVGRAEKVVFTTTGAVRAAKLIVTYEDYSTSEGTVSLVKTDDYGCEINHTLNWKVVDCSIADTVVLAATACDSYTWHDAEYTSSGTYYHYSTTSAGRDRVEILALTIHHSSTSEQVLSACESYTWTNGVTYTESGVYTQTLETVHGCDSVVTLHLTINQPVATEEIVTACDSFTWTDGKTYSESGVYTQHLQTIYGCDSVVTLHLTINQSVATEETVAACDSFTWTDGKTYSESGVYTQHLQTIYGCDSVATLHLTIYPSIATEETIIACDSYTWTNGETYTESGVYTQTLETVHGCDSVVTLHLTLHQSVVTEETVTACDSYTWTDGKTYTESGAYTQTLKTVNGCDSIVTLHLTINKTQYAEEIATVCDSYAWNGET